MVHDILVSLIQLPKKWFLFVTQNDSVHQATGADHDAGATTAPAKNGNPVSVALLGVAFFCVLGGSPQDQGIARRLPQPQSLVGPITHFRRLQECFVHGEIRFGCVAG